MSCSASYMSSIQFTCIIDLSPGITWTLEILIMCSMQLPFLSLWLWSTTDVEKSASRNHSSRTASKPVYKIFLKSVFSQKKKLIRKSQEDAKKDTICPELLQPADTRFLKQKYRTVHSVCLVKVLF